MDALELIDELRRQVNEFGNGAVTVADQIQPEWLSPITDIEFSAADQAYTIVTDP